ncbi:MAG: hypothetical protein ABSE63_10815 [Thermoguttaceae bacterium]|jgi:hypothetical protein
MASPFKVFRKHQKLMLAGLTILAMFSFVFLGTIGQLLDTRQTQNPVVVRTGKYGKLTVRDLAIMRQDHRLFIQIIAKIYTQALGINPETSLKLVERNFGSVSDEDLVNNWLKSKRAEEIGMVISDQTINGFLQLITAGKLAASDISAIIRQQGLNDHQFFDIIRDELRAVEITRLFEFSLEGITPAERWEYFCQLRKQASVELIAVEVEQFLDQVKAPSEEELKALFEKYKDKLPDPSSPEPGFRIPHKIDVQYFKAEFVKFSDPATITDEEFQSTYEKNRAYFDQLEKEESKSLTPEKKDEQGKEKTTEQEKNETTPAGEKPAQQPKEQPSDKQKPADQPGVERQKTPKEEPKKEETKKGDAQKSSALKRTPFSLTAMTEQAEKPAAEGPKTEKPAANQPAQPGKAEKAAPSLSEKVKQRVRAQVAGGKIQKIFLELQQKMEENGKKWRKYQAEKIHQINAAAPPSLDFEALAKQYGLTAGRTGLISNQEVKKFDIGSSVAMEGLAPFASAAFKPSLTAYKPEIAQDIEGNAYLYWKSDDSAESAASWDDKNVRQEVLHAWKLKQARDLARKQAKLMAEETAQTGATLKGAFPELPPDRLISPPPFSMLTEGSVPRGSSPAPPHLSEVEGVPMAGPDFMRAVFKLDINQTDVAMNLPQTVAYVVQLIKYSPPQDVLWQIFLAEDFNKYAVVAASNVQKEQNAWLESLRTSAGLKWEMKPEQPRGEPGPESFPED